MKILIVTDTYYPHVNGASYFCQRLSLQLLAKGHDVRVMAPSRSFHMEQTTFQNVPVYGMRSIPVLSYGYRFAPPFLLRSGIRKILQDFHPDIIHCNSHFSPNTVVLPVARELGIPIMASNHFVPENLMPYFHIPKFLYRFVRHIFWSRWSNTYRKFDAIVAPTEAAASIIRKHTPLQHILAISNGVDLERFHPDTVPEDVRKKYDTSSLPLFLYVGRLDKEKHVEVLLKAMHSLVATTPCRILIAGKGSDQDHLHILAQELGIEDSLSFLGFVPDEDLPVLYRMSDCFVIASIAELQSIATLEAIATGLPVVAANAMALPELVHHGENGFLFIPGDAEDCANAMKRILGDVSQKKSFGAASFKMAQKHAIKRSIEEFEELYGKLSERTGNH